MKRRVIGVVLLLIGLILIILTSPKLTGFAISEKNISEMTLKVLGIILFIGGILILSSQNTSEKILEDKINVYDDGIDKGNSKRNIARHYFMNDNKADFSRDGKVSLEEFRRQIESYKNEGEEELAEVVRQEYGPGLHRIVSEGGEKSKIARAFLDVLEGPKENARYQLSREDKREIRTAFRTYDGTLNSTQKDVLKKHGVSYERGAKHFLLVKGGKQIYAIPATPSDRRGGLNGAADIIKALEEYGAD